jgi:hypothetical protein
MPESQHLDYKREWWTPPNAGEEAAKDIAAMANAEGGDIIVGARERAGGRFDGFHNWNVLNPSDPKRFRKEPVADCLQLLSGHLRPRDFVEKIRARTVTPPRAPCPVLVVTVPRSPFVVGCATHAGHDAHVRYPIRTETRTDFLESGEVMRRMRDTDLWKRLRFREVLARDIEVTLFADMLMQFHTSEGTVDVVQARAGAAAVRWKVKEVGEESVVLRSRSERRRGVKPRHKNYRYAPIPESDLAIPYELIRTLWTSKPFEVLEQVHVMLDPLVGLMYEYPMWALYMRGPSPSDVIEEEPVFWKTTGDGWMVMHASQGALVLDPVDPKNWAVLKAKAPPPPDQKEEPDWSDEDGPV